MHTLILGGTSEASALAQLLAARPEWSATLSLAGRTLSPVLPKIAHRIGGFGGAEGLAQYLRDNSITALIDATHPFAKVMPYNAAKAAELVGIPLLALHRPAWEAEKNDQWTQVENHSEAIKEMGEKTRRIFLTVGRLEMDAYTAAPQHFYLVRSIDPIEGKPLPNAVWLEDRGPFSIINKEGKTMHTIAQSIELLSDVQRDKQKFTIVIIASCFKNTAHGQLRR